MGLHDEEKKKKKDRWTRALRNQKDDRRAEEGTKAGRSSIACAGESLSLLPPEWHP